MLTAMENQNLQPEEPSCASCADNPVINEGHLSVKMVKEGGKVKIAHTDIKKGLVNQLLQGLVVPTKGISIN